MKIRVPASSGNIGPGFDVCGLAVKLYNYFELTQDEGQYTLADEAFERFYKEINKKVPDYRVNIVESQVPISRGLGSSATLIVGGLVLANELEGRVLSDDQLLTLASEIEGHPDNVAPAIFGGVVISAERGGKIIYRKYDLDEDLGFVAFVPSYRLSTAEARKVIPSSIKKEAAIENTANTAMILLSLMEKDYKNLKHFMKDNIHEPYRSALIPDYEKVKSLQDMEEIVGVYLSGAGPTMMVLTQNPEELIKKLESDEKFKELEIKNLRGDNEGYKIIE